MSLPPNTLWYNGDWNLFVGIHDNVEGNCPCIVINEGPENCFSRPPNELNILNGPLLLMGTYTDFDVTDAFGWKVTGLFSNNFTTLPFGLISTFQANWEIRSGVSAYNGGTLIASGTSPVTVTPTGRSVIDNSILYTEYTFLVSGLNVVLPFGTYHMNVAPIVPEAITTSYGSQFLLFNSTTDGANAVGIPAGDNGNDFVVIGDPIPTNYFIPSTDFGEEFHDFSNGVVGIRLIICIDPDMEVTLVDNTKRKIRDLVPGNLLLTRDPKRPARLIINYRNETPHKVLVKMLPNSIEEGVPNQTLYITTNHPIVVNGEYRKPRELLNGDSVSRTRARGSVNTHTLVTDTGEPVLINNVPVSTWKADKWKKPSAKAIAKDPPMDNYDPSVTRTPLNEDKILIFRR
jgi:hypothetical protein